MKIAFILSMPGCPSWNGRWSGEGRLYVIVKPFTTVKAKAKAAELLATKWFSYGWSDGWRASIQIKEVDASEARLMKRKSAGFCGYDWMVSSILERSKILADHEIPVTPLAPAVLESRKPSEPLIPSDMF